MAGMLKKAMLYLGLGSDDEYDDYDPVERAPQAAPRGRGAGYPGPAEPETVAVRPVAARPSGATREREVMRDPSVRDLPAREHGDAPAVTVRPRPSAPSAVRAVTAGAGGKPHTVEPRSFNDAQSVADRFKDGQPVIVNLQNCNRDLSRRLIDFASGLCYGLGGTMERVATGVYLLTPAGSEVSAEERRRIAGVDD